MTTGITLAEVPTWIWSVQKKLVFLLTRFQVSVQIITWMPFTLAAKKFVPWKFSFMYNGLVSWSDRYALCSIDYWCKMSSFILALVETLVAKTRAWEENRGLSFMYDGVPLLAMLDEYVMLRQEREEEKKRMRVSVICSLNLEAIITWIPIHLLSIKFRLDLCWSLVIFFCYWYLVLYNCIFPFLHFTSTIWHFAILWIQFHFGWWCYI